jgi:hypothetical protein
MSYRFRNGKLQRSGGSVQIITNDDISPIPTPEPPKAKPKSEKNIIDEIKKVRINNNITVSDEAREKRLKKFVSFKI